ncbi:MAG: type II secretion system major pseudopilin GspG [Acidobacteria bacterium]|nr:type II secretion system major pseudopilin GspG [Acidobacteriota bacterium]
MFVNYEDRKSEEGMTLVEIIIVVVIIAMLVGVIGLKLGGKLSQAKEDIAQIAIADLEGSLVLYMVEVGNYPNSNEGLEALLQNPGNSPNWHGPYMKKDPKDPWGNPWVYQFPSQHGQEFDLCSNGADGIEGTEDDICNWK